jgi:hypothetical protein
MEWNGMVARDSRKEMMANGAVLCIIPPEIPRRK